MATGVSVIICCYNSAERIQETLSFISRQKLADEFLWEVIIINNASTDSTVDVIQKTIDSFNEPKFRIVHQPIPGLAHARQKGIEESRYDIIIFCDDDNHLNEDYVSVAYEIMQAHPEAAIAGGWVKPKLSVYPGKWIEDFYFSLAIGKQATSDGYVDWVFGAGMVLRKKILTELKERGISLLLSDRIGASQASGGDAELCMLARFIGYRVYYTSRLVLFHQIAAKRLRKKEFFRSNGDNFQSATHLFLMEQLIKNPVQHFSGAVISFAMQRATRLFAAIPRIMLGRNTLLQSIEIYGNFWFLIWMASHGPSIRKSFEGIKLSLFGGHKKV